MAEVDCKQTNHSYISPRSATYSGSNIELNAPGGAPRSDCQILRETGEPLKNRSIASLLTNSSATIISANGAV